MPRPEPPLCYDPATSVDRVQREAHGWFQPLRSRCADDRMEGARVTGRAGRLLRLWPRCSPSSSSRSVQRAGQDYFPKFDAATQADVVHVTSNLLARPDDDACAFDAEILAAEAGSALRRHGYTAVVLRPPVAIDGVTLDVSALVHPVLDTDACAVATRVQLVVVGDGVLLAAEHLLTWTTTVSLRRVSASVSRDAGAIAREMRRAADGGGWPRPNLAGY